MNNESGTTAAGQASGPHPRRMLIGYLAGVAGMSPVSLASYRLFAPVGALLITAIFAAAAIWSRPYADFARGALAATLFGITAIIAYIVIVNN